MNIENKPEADTCNTSDVEQDWVEHLDESLGVTQFNSFNTGTRYIRYAKRWGTARPLIPWSYDDTPELEQFDFQSVAMHELGHGVGMWHFENHNRVPYRLDAGEPPLMRAERRDARQHPPAKP